VKLPNKHDSLPFRLIAGHPKATEIFTAWVLMVQVASKGKREDRGNLPLSPDELGIVTGFPAKIFELAIEFLKSPKIGWIEQSPDASGNSPDMSGNSPDNLPLKEGKKEGKEESLVDFLFPDFKAAVSAYPSGKKRGAEVEWADFLKKNRKRAAEVVPLLLPAVLGYVGQIKATKMEPKFIKHFQGWITEERWTVDYGSPAIAAETSEEKSQRRFREAHI